MEAIVVTPLYPYLPVSPATVPFANNAQPGQHVHLRWAQRRSPQQMRRHVVESWESVAPLMKVWLAADSVSASTERSAPNSLTTPRMRHLPSIRPRETILAACLRDSDRDILAPPVTERAKLCPDDRTWSDGSSGSE